MRELSYETRNVIRALTEPARVLFIDDNGSDRDLFSKLIEDYHCVLEVASTGGDGMEKGTSREYTLIVLDLHLPDSDALEIFRKIRLFNSARGKLCRIITTSEVFNGIAQSILDENGFISFAKKSKLMTVAFFEEMMLRVGVRKGTGLGDK